MEHVSDPRPASSPETSAQGAGSPVSLPFVFWASVAAGCQGAPALGPSTEPIREPCLYSKMALTASGSSELSRF